MSAAEYREWNELLRKTVPEDFRVPWAAKYEAGTWTPCAEADGIIQVIIGHQDSLYLRHRLHFFRWAIYQTLEEAGKLDTEIKGLEVSRSRDLKSINRITTETSKSMFNLGMDTTNPIVKEREEVVKSIQGRLATSRKRMAILTGKRQALWDRSIVYEEVFWMLTKYRDKEDQQRLSDGRRAIWDLNYGKLPGPDEASADGNTPPPSPPAFSPVPPTQPFSPSNDKDIEEALEAFQKMEDDSNAV